MARIKFKVPIELEATDEEIDAAEAVRDVVEKARSVGLWDALSHAAKKTVCAARSVAARRRRP